MNDLLTSAGPRGRGRGHHRPLDENQGLRWVHAPPLLLPPDRHRGRRRTEALGISPETLTVSHLRCLYSSLLGEMAPRRLDGDPQFHDDVGSVRGGGGYRWKGGTVDVDGDDEGGYDYSYRPDDTDRGDGRARNAWGLPSILFSSRRLVKGIGVVVDGGGGGGGRRRRGRDVDGCGITGGDWSRDGIRRYHTGGAVVMPGGGGGSSPPSSSSSSSSSSPPRRSYPSNVIRVGTMDVDISTMDGVSLNGPSGPDDDRSIGAVEVELDEKYSIDDDDDDEENDNGTVGNLEGPSSLDRRDGDVVSSSSDGRPPPFASASPSPREAGFETGHVDGGGGGGVGGGNINITMFESMYHLAPSTVWRLRSAYSPRTPQESHLDDLGSEILAHRHPGKADAMMRGLRVARESEARVCQGLRRIGEAIGSCERLRGSRIGRTRARCGTTTTFGGLVGGDGALGVDMSTYSSRDGDYVDNGEDDDDDDDDDVEAAEATFAYFCEKNILPMLVDSLLCRPPPLTSSDAIINASNDEKNVAVSNGLLSPSPSPFSAVTWTSSVKSQILQTIAMILFNTSHPLSLTYLLSNNYMNELIIGMLPLDLDQWKDEALEDILPPYVTLLRGLVMKLRGDEGRSLLPLFLCRRRRRIRCGGTTAVDHREDLDSTTETYLPVLYAAVHVFCSPRGTNLRDYEGCLVRTTAMNVILNLARIADPKMRSVLVQSDLGDETNGSSLPMTKSSAASLAPLPSMLSHPLTIEEELLFPHICNSLNSWYNRSVRLVMASLSIKDKRDRHREAKAEAKDRHKDIAEIQFSDLQFWLGFLDDLFSCGIDVWNARLIEFLLRDCVVGMVLLRLNRSLEVIGRKYGDRAKISPDVYKARAEIRVSIVFLTQVFGMIEYKPFVRLVGAVVLNPKYPLRWCGSVGTRDRVDTSKKDGFFAVTLAINSIIGEKVRSGGCEEPDAGAGANFSHNIQDLIGENEVHANSSTSSCGTIDPHGMCNHHQSVVDSGHNNDKLIPSRHRAALLDMLAGRPAYSSDETILASMLLAVILENDAIDDMALEVFGVLPSPTINNEGDSPFETSIATHLLSVGPVIDLNSQTAFASAVKCVSSLGFMLLERLIFHTWTEAGQCIDVVPFEHFYNSSKLIQALGRALSFFASQAQSHLHDVTSIREIFSACIRQRYSINRDANDCLPLTNPEKLVCSLQNYYPSNFIDNASVLAGEIEYVGAHIESATTDLFLFNHDNEIAMCALQTTLHLRSLLTCIQEFYERFESNSDTRWSNRRDFFSFRTIEEADDVILSIGGIQMTPPLGVGADIDLRGRTFFHCTIPSKSRGNQELIIGENGMKIRVAANSELELIVGALEIFVTTAMRDSSYRCTTLAVVPLQTIIASATEGDILHIVCQTDNHHSVAQGGIVQNGRLSLRFALCGACDSAKESLDRYCAAYEKKIVDDANDMLEKCSLIGDNILTAPSQLTKVEEAWCDFQQA